MIISLSAVHQKRAPFSHQLLEGAPSYSNEEIDEIAQKVAAGELNRNDLTMALLFCVRSLVGRFFYYYPTTKSSQDDMVSVGIEALVSFEPGVGNVLKSASQAAQDAIQRYLNYNKAISAASLRQQWNLVKKQGGPIYRQSVGTEIPEEVQPQEKSDERKRDVLDAFAQIKPKDDIDTYLMNEYNWGRKYRELAEELGVSIPTIHRRKAKIYKRYLEIVG